MKRTINNTADPSLQEPSTHRLSVLLLLVALHGLHVRAALDFALGVPLQVDALLLRDKLRRKKGEKVTKVRDSYFLKRKKA